METQKPLLFINIAEDGKCVVNPDALAVIRSIQTPVCVVSIAGLYRTGKSFLLNRLLGLQDAFEIGPTVNPCTKGLWIWGAPIPLPNNRSLILIDTEGLGSFERDEKVDMHIFSLALLLSSMLIYNSMGAIDEQAIASLSLVCKLTQHVHIRANAANTAAAYSAYFPAFIWVLRDFSLQLMEAGKKTSSRDYLEGCLRPVEGSSADVQTKNQIRRTILEFFKDRDCVTLIRPVNDERQLREINTLPYDSLRPKFKEQMDEFVTKVLGTVRVKMIEGATLSGSMLADLTEQYALAINNDSIPAIAPAWERVIDSQLKSALKQGVQVYKTYMTQRVIPTLPIEEADLQVHDQTARTEALKVFAGIPTNPGNAQKLAEIKAKINEKFDEIRQGVVFENAKESKTACIRIARESLSEFEAKSANFKRGQEMIDAWETVCRAYESRAKGPSKLETAWELIGKPANLHFSRVINRLENNSQTQLRDAAEKAILMKSEMMETQRKLQFQQAEFEEALEAERRKQRDHKKQLEDTVEDAKSVLGSNNRHFASLQEKLQKENLELTEEVRKLKGQLSGRGDTQSSLDQILQQLRQSQDEKTQLSLRLEYETKVSRKSKVRVGKDGAKTAN